MGSSGGFSDQERAAMKERAAELEKEKSRGRGNKKAAEELDLLAKLESMDPADRALAERIHAIVTTAAPDLAPKLWYGQPAYALKGKVVCFFRSGHDDKERYSTLGFTQNASLDDGGFWPTSFAVSTLDTEAEKTIATLVAKAVS
ncbi:MULTISPECIES: DUF1801 domain-containing protein [Gordonia]|jgi:uncharacterized protein YdhG (YjbR/CyaY superfamily)|uniref:DUF1801 domain-containing protein n=1 Tax=Gordonia hongkongensis TaxID=1701090 RepID=A0ABT6C114_9ACTN|nr:MULTISPECIES: DUF1801 domain-containing protein [Gordonia]MDF6104042.1 DUF1801 domain-containing protein [Gordonia hongkongensis]UCZ91568.1 DUF1801 domain-containing protein [Gordonia sp. WA4-43]WGJ84476.1 DUF1801 domain-containing protein [Gordonia sp. SMJS1]